MRLPMSSYLVRDPGSGALYGTLPHHHHLLGQGQQDLTRQRSLANIGEWGYGEIFLVYVMKYFLNFTPPACDSKDNDSLVWL